METGTVKFSCESSGQKLAAFPGFPDLNAARQELRRLGLLGMDENGIGFGNVSLRDGASSAFYITGSGTGSLPALAPADYAKVIAWDFERNWLRCEGRVIASAESLTHAAVYAMEPDVRVVMHGHDSTLWHDLLERGAATRRDVLYGTTEMAREVQRFLKETDAQSTKVKVFAMSGHENGIIVFARDFEEALSALKTVRTRSD